MQFWYPHIIQDQVQELVTIRILVLTMPIGKQKTNIYISASGICISKVNPASCDVEYLISLSVQEKFTFRIGKTVVNLKFNSNVYMIFYSFKNNPVY